jgi:hypothetical protein
MSGIGSKREMRGSVGIIGSRVSVITPFRTCCLCDVTLPVSVKIYWGRSVGLT